MSSHEIAAADALLTANAELRAALAVAMRENDQHQAVNARLVRELVYARAVIAAARRYRSAVADLNGISAAEAALLSALEAYEASEKASTE